MFIMVKVLVQQLVHHYRILLLSSPEVVSEVIELIDIINDDTADFNYFRIILLSEIGRDQAVKK